MWIGIDFGTTNSAAACYMHGKGLDILPLNPLEPTSRTIRTIIYVERDHSIRIGKEAIRAYYEQNSGRMPRLTMRRVGTIEITDSLGTRLQPVYADVDETLPGRLIHSLKSELTTESEGTNLFGKVYSLDDLIAEYLSILHFRITQHIKSDIEGVVLGRPVNFAGAVDDNDNDHAQRRLEEAARAAGFRNIDFELEPIAAGISLQLRGEMYEAKNVLVFDFGGGTIDIAVIRICRGQHDVLATGGLGIAGDRFDQLIAEHKLLDWFGRNANYGTKCIPFPRHLGEAILRRQDIPYLHNSETMAFLRNAQRNTASPFPLYTLEELISRNNGHVLFETIEATKVRLSTHRFSIIDFMQDQTSVWQPLTRLEFEQIIDPEREKIEQITKDTIARANQKPADIDYVVRTGGSSSIPCFVRMLAKMFGQEKLIQEDIFTGVVSGLAIKAYENSR